MDKEQHLTSSQIQSGKIIGTTRFDGPTQMACDVFMLEKLNDKTDISIRFYKWEGLWLSIGKHQKHLPKRWLTLLKDRKLNIVRRPSGGSAVLHSGGITYALAWRSPPKKRHQAYVEASHWLIHCFDEIGLPLRFGNQPQIASSENCFSSSTIADLVDDNGIKRIGSAQLWKDRKLLQHGEILLDPPKEIWSEIFNQKAPPPISPKIPREGLEKLLTKGFIKYWSNVQWNHTTFESNEIKEIQKYSKNYLIESSKSDF